MRKRPAIPWKWRKPSSSGCCRTNKSVICPPRSGYAPTPVRRSTQQTFEFPPDSMCTHLHRFSRGSLLLKKPTTPTLRVSRHPLSARHNQATFAPPRRAKVCFQPPPPATPSVSPYAGRLAGQHPHPRRLPRQQASLRSRRWRLLLLLLPQRWTPPSPASPLSSAASRSNRSNQLRPLVVARAPTPAPTLRAAVAAAKALQERGRKRMRATRKGAMRGNKTSSRGYRYSSTVQILVALQG